MASILNATTSSGLVTSADNSGSLQLATNSGTTAVTVTTAQLVGIGTASPLTKLHVDGTGNQNIRLSSSTHSNFVQSFCVSGSTGVEYKSVYRFVDTDAGERMNLTSGGNLLIGITTPLPNNTGKITTYATSGSTAGWVSKGNANGYYGSLFENQSDTTVGYIQVNSTTTNFSTTSDYRLKENVAPMTGALATVTALKPCTYKWKIDGSDGQGFIAHELAEVCPQAVSGEKDAVDEDGKIVPQGVDTSFLVATLTAALQEAHGLIKDLQARVETLEAK